MPTVKQRQSFGKKEITEVPQQSPEQIISEIIWRITMRLKYLGFSLAIAGCGMNTEDLNKAGNLEQAKQSRRSESEPSLGIVAAKADDFVRFGRFISGRVPLNAPIAFGSFVSYAASSTKNSCAGAFAFEPDALNPRIANVYFYTAVHCFESINPLGQTVIKLSRSGISFAAPKRFSAPFAVGNQLPANISNGVSEVLYSGSKRMDVLRIHQGRIDIALARQQYLPACSASGMNFSPKESATGAMAFDSQGVAQANARASTAASGVTMTTIQLGQSQLEAISSVVKLEDIGGLPGESGGPVWFIDGREEIDRMNSYLCLKGVMSRELARPSLNLDGSYSIAFDSFYAPLLVPSDTIKWVSVN